MPGSFRHHESVQLPRRIQLAIDERVDALGFRAVKRAAAVLSDAYREGRAPQLSSAELVAAYLVTRMPATYAAVRAALAHSIPLLAGRAIGTVLDVGAGSGAASLAASEHFPDARFTVVERNPVLGEVALAWLPRATALAEDAARAAAFPPHDLVLASYSLGEMRAGVAERLWQAARVALIILEPGTPKGFAFLREIRSTLLDSGAHMLAPCPAATPCPMAGSDWCHFAARVERSSLHRRLKDAALNYEDEKYSYIAFARDPAALPAARIIRHPQHQPGLIQLELCTAAGLRSEPVWKRDRDRFRSARHAAWGDSF